MPEPEPFDPDKKDQMNLLPVVSIDDRYKIEEQIGTGGMGTVFKAKHLLLNREMAVKVLNAQAVSSPKAITRFQQEAKAATALSHEHIVSVKEFGMTKDGMPFLAMDYINGSSLSDEFKKGTLDASRTVDIFMQLSEGMAHAHERGILHRDLKPGNILLTEERNRNDFVKIVDFGIAKILPEADQESVKLTQTGEMFGTPLYMSPEQWDGGVVDARTDIYSMGCVMYEAVTGKPPFAGPTVASIAFGQLREAPKPFATHSKELKENKDKKGSVQKKLLDGLENVTLRCLEKDPKLRYQSMNEVHDALKLVREGRTPRAGVSQSALRRGRLLRFATACLVVLLLLISSYIVFPIAKSILFPPIWLQTLAAARKQTEISAWESAEALFRRAIRQAEEGHASASDLHAIYYDSGVDYINMHQYAAAADAFEKALRYCDESRDPLGEANTLEELAMCLHEKHFYHGVQDNSEASLNDLKRALQFAEKALKLKETNAGPNHPFVTYTLEKLAPIYLTLGDAEKAESALRRAIKIDEATPETRPRAEKHWEALAKCFKTQFKTREAADCIEHALEMSKELYGANSEKAERLEQELKKMQL